MAQQLLLLLPAPSRTFSKPLHPLSSSLPRRYLPSISATRHVVAGVAAARRDLLRCGMRRSDLVSELELAKDKKRQGSRPNGIFWILLLNFGLYIADHLLQIREIKALYLYHAFPSWYQFVTSTFCHANWNHLSSNLFFVYIFGKLVEEEEGNFALWMSYILTGARANSISWLVLSTSSVSLGASSTVFGLFTISGLVKMSWDWRKIIDVLILGQFVVDKKIEGNLPGVHYVRDVADADSLVSSLEKAKKILVIGGGYIGMEVAAAAYGWNLDTTIRALSCFVQYIFMCVCVCVKVSFLLFMHFKWQF